MDAGNRVCVVGADGMLGRELTAALRRGGARRPVEVAAFDLPDLDITKSDSVEAVVGRFSPTLLINAAAFTDVDGAESRPVEAAAVNADGPKHLALACRARGCRLVHVSTDFVFDGGTRTAYRPDDPVNPLSVYGRTKALGDDHIRETLENHVIVRTSWLFGVHGRNFVKTIRKLAAERDELRVVTDQVGCPTYARDLAEALLAIAFGDCRGTFHFCNAGSCSWNEFACEIVRLSGGRAKVLPITSADLNRPAVRPAYSVLDTTSFTEATGTRPRPWKDALADCLRELAEAESAGAVATP